VSLGVVVTRVAQFLTATMASPPPRIGGAEPAAASDVPAVVLSIAGVTEVPAGIGQTAARYRGQLAVDVVAANATEVDQVSDAVGAALRPGTSAALGAAYVLTPTSWGPIGAVEPALGDARRRTLTFRFDFELADVGPPDGGDLIAQVDVRTSVDGANGSLLPDRDFSVSSREE
jgi:hypothetical protein